MKKLILVLALSLVLGLLTSAQATMTPVYDTTWNVNPYYEWDLLSGLPKLPGAPSPGNGSSDGADDILNRYYSSWARIDDSSDQTWLDLNGGVSVIAIYTSSSHYLGYSLDETTGSSIVNVPGAVGNLDTVGETGHFDIADNSDAFVWALLGGGTKYSRQALNGGADYMVSFRINGIYNNAYDHSLGYTVPSDPTYVIAFEDGTDKDYQDFVFQLSKVSPAVPEPASMTLLGLGLLGFLGLKRKKAL